MFLAVSLEEIFRPELPLLELLIRGSATYLFLFALLRFVQKRQAGALGIADLLVVLLVTHGAHNALVGEYKSLSDGAILVCTIFGWNLAINWLAFHVPLIGSVVHPSPIELIHEGEENWKNLRTESISRDELLSHVRKAGAEDIGDVKRAWMEGNGQISILTYSGGNGKPSEEFSPL